MNTTPTPGAKPAQNSAASNPDADFDPDANPHTNTGTDPGPDADANADPGPDANPPTDASTDPGRGADPHTDASADPGRGADPHTGVGMDPAVRRAARTAAMIALPIALIAGAGVFFTLRSTGNGSPVAAASPSAASGHPRDAGSRAGGPVAMPAGSLGPQQTTVCRALLAKLPQRLRDRPQRAVTAGPEQNAAWGDPPLTLACGTPGPTAPADAQVWLLDGVCWLNHDRTAWTTVDREVPVTVRIPGGYGAAGQWVIEFSAPIVAAVPSATDTPAGCRP